MGVSPLTADFPRNLREVLSSRLKSSRNSTSDPAGLQEKVGAGVDELLAVKDIDPDIIAVLEHVRDSRDR